ncbi:hypothetical protein QUF76_07290 [Desulfobacterales bacterium HSG16]|nr:hypothetical protein [Desulfobacterales bacterium HSG16]
MSKFSEQIKNIAQDLVSLEVNTIIKPNMTGRKMPKPRHALIDIAQNYNRKLIEIGFPLSRDIIPGSYENFRELIKRADERIKALKARSKSETLGKVDESNLFLLFRIKRMSEQVKSIFAALERRGVKNWENKISREEIDKQQPPLPLNTDELVMIRKIWEMGLEEIAMQTLIQLDGDVLTRIQPKYAKKNFTIVHDLHNQSVATSMKFWGQLIGILQDFFSAMASKIMK